MLTANMVAYIMKLMSFCKDIMIRHTSVARWTSPSHMPSQSAIAWFIERNLSAYCFPCSWQTPRILFVCASHILDSVVTLIQNGIYTVSCLAWDRNQPMKACQIAFTYSHNKLLVGIKVRCAREKRSSHIKPRKFKLIELSILPIKCVRQLGHS